MPVYQLPYRSRELITLTNDTTIILSDLRQTEEQLQNGRHQLHLLT